MSDAHKNPHALKLEKWAREGAKGGAPIPAATVILLRDGASGIETLMLRRNSKIAFGGMWVFPGGRLDPADWQDVAPEDDLTASRQAARREAIEECGLRVVPEDMIPFSHWTPPPISPKRFVTWFFMARPEAGDVSIDDGEITESLWINPAEALRRQSHQKIEIAAPTYVSLTELTTFSTVEGALAAVRARTPERFRTHISVTDVGPVALWHGDAGYSTRDVSAVGERHRLTMAKSGFWRYERTTERAS